MAVTMSQGGSNKRNTFYDPFYKTSPTRRSAAKPPPSAATATATASNCYDDFSVSNHLHFPKPLSPPRPLQPSTSSAAAPRAASSGTAIAAATIAKTETLIEQQHEMVVCRVSSAAVVISSGVGAGKEIEKEEK